VDDLPSRNQDVRSSIAGVGNYFNLGATLRRPRSAEGRAF